MNAAVYLAVNVAGGIVLLAAALAGIALAEVVHRRADAAREHRRPITISRTSWRGRTLYRWHVGHLDNPAFMRGSARTRPVAIVKARAARRWDAYVDWRSDRARDRQGRVWTIR